MAGSVLAGTALANSITCPSRTITTRWAPAMVSGRWAMMSRVKTMRLELRIGAQLRSHAGEVAGNLAQGYASFAHSGVQDYAGLAISGDPF